MQPIQAVILEIINGEACLNALNVSVFFVKEGKKPLI
jgi:hypothetical protein